MTQKEQRLEQLEDEFAKVEMQLRRTRAELDEIGISKVPENVKPGTFLDAGICYHRRYCCSRRLKHRGYDAKNPSHTRGYYPRRRGCPLSYK